MPCPVVVGGDGQATMAVLGLIPGQNNTIEIEVREIEGGQIGSVVKNPKTRVVV